MVQVKTLLKEIIIKFTSNLSMKENKQTKNKKKKETATIK